MKTVNQKHSVRKVLAIVALSMFASIGANAQESGQHLKDVPGSTIRLKNNTTKSMWITIYNFVDSIRDSGCINAGDSRDFGNYYGPFNFRVRAEVADGANCNGPTLADVDKTVGVPSTFGVELTLQTNVRGGYFLEKTSGVGNVEGTLQEAHQQAVLNENAPPSTKAWGVIDVRNHTNNAMWMTIYNTFSMITDVSCVPAGSSKSFGGYSPPLAYRVRAEVARNSADCTGGTIRDLYSPWFDATQGKNMALEQKTGGDFFWNAE